jgi:hypothetical protein
MPYEKSPITNFLGNLTALKNKKAYLFPTLVSILKIGVAIL